MIMQRLRKILTLTVILGLSLFSTACSNLLNTSAPTPAVDELQVKLPAEETKTLIPTVVYSDKAVAYFKQAVVHLSNSTELKQAQSAFNQALRIEPKMEAAYFNLIRMKFDEFSKLDLDKSESVAEQALIQKSMQEIMQRAETNDSLSARVLTIAGTTERQLGNFKQAESLYLKGLTKQANYLPLLINLAILEDIYLGNLEKALQYYLEYEAQYSLQEAANEKQAKDVKNWLADLKRRIAKQNKEKSS